MSENLKISFNLEPKDEVNKLIFNALIQALFEYSFLENELEPGYRTEEDLEKENILLDKALTLLGLLKRR